MDTESSSSTSLGYIVHPCDIVSLLIATMAPVSMPNSSTEERISELEGYLNTALDVLQDRGFLLGK